MTSFEGYSTNVKFWRTPTMGKKKVVLEIENLFHSEGQSVLSFHAIQDKVDEKRSTLLGVLSSHPRLFEKIRTNEWRLIPDDTTDLDSVCQQYGIDREKLDSVIDDSGSLRYSWIRVQRSEEGFSTREVHYLIHTMRKHGKLALPEPTQ
jgi:hypothetical protein